MAIPEHIKRIPLWIYLLLIGFITFYTYDIFIAADMAKYMTYALNILLKKGYIDLNGELTLSRGPIFPIMISWFYRLLGVSPWSAFWVVRIFCIFNPVVIYLLGKKLFGKKVGLISALLILTSYSVNYWSYRHLDAVWPFFIFMAILILIRGFELERNIYFILSGLFAAVAFLVKESSLLIFPLPPILLIVITEYRKKRNVIGTLIWVSVVFSVIFPWLYYIYYIKKIGFVGVNIIFDSLNSNPNLPQLMKYYITGLIDYYSGFTQSLSVNFAISPLFIVAWLFTLFRAFQKDRGCIICIVCLMLLSPYIAFVGKNNMRLGQLIIFLLLSYMVIGYFLHYVFKFIEFKLTKLNKDSYKKVHNSISIIIVSLIIGIQIFIHWERDRGGVSFLKRSFFINYFQNTKKREVKGVFNESLYKVADWIESNVPYNAKIAGGSWAYNRVLYILTKGKFNFQYFPLLKLRYLSSEIRKQSLSFENKKYSLVEFKLPPPNDLIFFSTHGRNNNPRLAKGWLLYESHLLAELEEENIKYIIIGPVFNFLSKYFEKSNSFVKVSSFNNSSDQVFQIKGKINSSPHSIYITKRTISCLNTLKKKDLESFKFINKFLKKNVGFEESQINSILLDRLNKPFEKVRFVKQQ